MANLDTRSKRASSVGLLMACVLAPPLPDGTIAQADRQHISYTYSGIAAGVVWILHHADNFTGTGSDIDNRTMSDGFGLWSKRAGTIAIGIASNQAVVGAGGVRTGYYDAADTAIDQQRSAVTCVTTVDSSFGPMVRVQADGSGYVLIVNTTAAQVYKWDAVGDSLTGVGASVGAVADGDVVMLEAQGGTLKAFVNGVEKISAADATYATGRPGVFGYVGTGVFDNWNSYGTVALNESTDLEVEARRFFPPVRHAAGHHSHFPRTSSSFSFSVFIWRRRGVALGA